MTALSVCVVNYNGLHCLQDCLGALLASSQQIAEIIVIDNASTDGSVEISAQAFPSVRLIRLSENLGPAVARNHGLLATTSERVLLVDNDVAVTPPCIERLMSAMSDSEAAVAMPRVCYRDRKDIIQYDGAGCHPLGLMVLKNHNRPIAEGDQALRVIRSVVTACILVDKQRLRMAQPFDESFFFNYEDHDFGLRCSVTGGKIVSVPAALCYHGTGTKALSYRSNGTYATRRVYCLIRNRWLILLKVYRVRTLLRLLPVLLLYEVFQVVGLVARGWFAQWLSSLHWVFTHRTEILNKRRDVQKLRAIDDFELFEESPLPFTEGLARGPIERATIALLDRVLLSYFKLIRPASARASCSQR